MAGMLFVTMQPRPGLPPGQFHEWYNNEHGPTRLRMPAMFANGLRYRATDGKEPAYLAAYDVRDMGMLATPAYSDLRTHRSAREAATIGQVDVKRHLWHFRSAQHTAGFVAPEDVAGDGATGRVLIYVEVTVHAGQDKSVTDTAVEQVCRWYEEEHFPLLSHIPGWLRSRLYYPAQDNGSNATPRLITLHEYDPVNGLGGPEHKASMDTPWRTDVFARFIGAKARRAYSLFYVFGPAPRDLASLAGLPPTAAFASADGQTKTLPSPPTIRSFVTLPDGLDMHYQLEGNTAPDAPTIAFCNSLLTSLDMWAPFVARLRSERPNYRILRYDMRGRSASLSPASPPATLATLADDLAALLAALRIPKLHALIGVSLGGATAMQFGLRHPSAVGRLVACDFNIASSPGNTAAWKERIASASDPDGMATLAKATVVRWFSDASITRRPDTTAEMTAMVAANPVDGFRCACQALWDYDMRDTARTLQPPVLLVVGSEDGALPKAIEGFRNNVGPTGAELRLVPGVGHLPMVEDPDAFWVVVKDFI